VICFDYTDMTEQILCELVDAQQFTHKRWVGTKFSSLKFASPTEKGSIGEDLLGELLRELGYSNVKVVENRRGDYDVSVQHKKRNIKFEVKVATQDVNGSFQFNGIRYDTGYTHLFCLGVLPTTILYKIVSKSELTNQDNYRLASMQKDTNATFKLTRTENELRSFKHFKSEITQLLKP